MERKVKEHRIKRKHDVEIRNKELLVREQKKLKSMAKAEKERLEKIKDKKAENDLKRKEVLDNKNKLVSEREYELAEKQNQFMEQA